MYLYLAIPGMSLTNIVSCLCQLEVSQRLNAPLNFHSTVMSSNFPSLLIELNFEKFAKCICCCFDAAVVVVVVIVAVVVFLFN